MWSFQILLKVIMPIEAKDPVFLNLKRPEGKLDFSQATTTAYETNTEFSYVSAF